MNKGRLSVGLTVCLSTLEEQFKAVRGTVCNAAQCGSRSNSE